MINRSKEFWLVAFFLSKYSEGKNPPHEFKTNLWNETYRMFYESLGHGRTILSFEHSIKTARDSFDSHFRKSARIGWRDKDGTPQKLESIASKIFQKYSKKSRESIWNEIEKFIDMEVFSQSGIINDLIAIQESESNNALLSKTEGGKKIVTSFRYERNISLRKAAIQLHGFDCFVCGFNFEKFYGIWGKDFAEVHHVISLAEYKDKSITDVEKDLVILCANCHRMIHRKKGTTLTVEELKSKINP